MHQFFTELFSYSHHYNQRLIELLVSQPDNVSDKTTRLISHILNAHHIWNARINGLPATTAVWDVHPLSVLADMDKSNFDTSLEIVNRNEWARMLPYKTSRGEPFSNTVRDILFHIINHSTYHRAQIATELKQAGIAPLTTDYIFYKR